MQYILEVNIYKLTYILEVEGSGISVRGALGQIPEKYPAGFTDGIRFTTAAVPVALNTQTSSL